MGLCTFLSCTGIPTPCTCVRGMEIWVGHISCPDSIAFILLNTFFLKCKLEYQSDFATNVAHLLVLFPLEKKTLDLSQDSVKLGSCCYFYTCINLPHSMQTSAHIRSGKSAKTIPDFLWFVRVSLSWLVIHFFLCSLSPCCHFKWPNTF